MIINGYKIGPGANLREANLQGIDLRDANLRRIDLRGANLLSANLQRTDLWGANLLNANLEDTDLRSTNLRNASLLNANLQGANLRKASLQDIDLRGAAFNKDTKWPSPGEVLLSWWGNLSDQLTADLMLFDSRCHPDPAAFDRWVEIEICPYSDCDVPRSANFQEQRELWGRGVICRPYDLMQRVLQEKCTFVKD